MVDLDAIVSQAKWREMALDAISEGYKVTREEALRMLRLGSAKVVDGVLSFDYDEPGGRIVRGEIEVK